MTNLLIETITDTNPTVRNRSLSELVEGVGYKDLLTACAELETFRRTSGNLYDRVRACMFLFGIYRFYLMESPEGGFHSVPGFRRHPGSEI
jgi:hypothetical protein